MATRKQRHARALEKRERELAEYRRTGLEALRKDQKRRFQKELDAWEENHKKNHSWEKRIVECPHCRREMRDAVRSVDTAANVSTK